MRCFPLPSLTMVIWLWRTKESNSQLPQYAMLTFVPKSTSSPFLVEPFVPKNIDIFQKWHLNSIRKPWLPAWHQYSHRYWNIKLELKLNIPCLCILDKTLCILLTQCVVSNPLLETQFLNGTYLHCLHTSLLVGFSDGKLCHNTWVLVCQIAQFCIDLRRKGRKHIS